MEAHVGQVLEGSDAGGHVRQRLGCSHMAYPAVVCQLLYGSQCQRERHERVSSERQNLFCNKRVANTNFLRIYNTFARTADRMDDPLPFIIPLPSLTTFAAMMFVAGQMQTIIEFFLRRQLKTFRAQAYQVTVQSRGKDTSWWGPYVEEWEEPPYAKAEKSGKKAKLYIRLASPIVTRFVLRIVLLPLDFVPFLSLATGAYVRSLAYGRQLLTPFFASKRMTPMQVELFMTERQASLRLYGFSCALMERFPLIGIVFSISNRVGAAMLAHDLEKRQHSFASGERKKLKKEETYNLGEIKGWKDLVRPSSPTSSQRNKLPFAPQAEDDFAMPGAVFSAGSGQARQRPVPSVPTSGTGSATSHAASSQHVFPDAPPAYTEQDAMQALGEHS